jgi:hypothetical protein
VVMRKELLCCFLRKILTNFFFFRIIKKNVKGNFILFQTFNVWKGTCRIKKKKTSHSFYLLKTIWFSIEIKRLNPFGKHFIFCIWKMSKCWVSSCLSFFLRASAAYIFAAPTCTTTIITFEPCALNAKFQHFILKISLLCVHHWESDRGRKRAQG